MRSRLAPAVAVLGWLLCTGFVQAGELQPPGAPAPTMKTLEEVEPRVPIHASDLPLEITQPGNYYLVEDVEATGNIKIWTSDVTIDLMGHRLVAAPGAPDEAAIESMATSYENIEIRDGWIEGWGAGGLDLEGDGHRVLGVTVSNTGGFGIYVRNEATIRDCTAELNYYGIRADNYTVVEDCRARSNESVGIWVENSSVVRRSIASFNGSYGIRGNGRHVLVEDSSAISNDSIGIWINDEGRVIRCQSSQNGSEGIRADDGGSVRDCFARRNDQHGIRVFHDALVLNNTSLYNGYLTADIGYGISVDGADSRIEGNHVTGNDIGVAVSSGGNCIVKNSASGNGTDYDIVGGNDVGPIGSAATATSPWANIEF